jgi:hypothetical protein
MNLKTIRNAALVIILGSCGDDPSYQTQEETTIPLSDEDRVETSDSRGKNSETNSQAESQIDQESAIPIPTPTANAQEASCEDVYREAVEPTFRNTCASCHEYIPSFELSLTDTRFNFTQYQRTFVGNEENMVVFFSSEGTHPGGRQPEISGNMMAKMKDACD